MSKTGKKAVQQGSSDDASVKDAKKREILKKAGIAGGVAATGAWTKPVVNSMVLPAHATTSPAAAGGGGGLVMAGASSQPVTFRNMEPGERESLFARIASGIIPAANAQAACASPSTPSRYAFDGNHTICVGLEFPEGKKADGPVNITVTGSDIFYSFYSAYYGDNYYDFSHNLSGSAPTTLTGLGFAVSIGNLDICGSVTDADFSGATGYIVNNASFGAYDTQEESGYGASFNAIPGLPCSPGPGPDVSLYEAYSGAGVD